MNAEAYLTRIGYKGPVDTTYETLNKLCICHRSSVPFENLSPFGVGGGGRYKTLNPEDWYEEIVVKKQGGYCYEVNGLFAWLLRELGFQLTIMQGNALVPRGPDEWKFELPFDHMVLLVTTADGRKWVVDMAWTGRGIMSPVQFDVDIAEQEQKNNGVFRIRRYFGDDGNPSVDSYLLQAVTKTTLDAEGQTPVIDKKWETVYKFDTVPRQISDYAEMNARQQDLAEGALFTARNTFCCLTRTDGCTQMWGSEIVTKVFDDPLTQRIVSKQKLNADDQGELRKVIAATFGLNVDYELRPRKEKISGDLQL